MTNQELLSNCVELMRGYIPCRCCPIKCDYEINCKDHWNRYVKERLNNAIDGCEERD